MHRPSAVRIITATSLAMLAGFATTAAPDFAAANHKTASACITYGQVSCGTTATLTAGPVTLQFTITNTSTGPQAVPYGSFQLPVPSGINICSAGATGPSTVDFNPVAISPTPPTGSCAAANTVTVTTNGPTGSGVGSLQSAVVTVQAVATTAVCPGIWFIEVKQSNDFSGSGNDFIVNTVTTPVAGGDHLSWTAQPSNVQVSNAVSPAPAVSVLDACGNVDTSLDPLTVTASDISTDPATPSPTFAAQTVNGVATFSSAVSVGGVANSDIKYGTYGYDHKLLATATGTTTCASGGTCYSSSFHVYQLLKACSTNGKTDCVGNGLADSPTTPFTVIGIDAAAGTNQATLTADVYPNGQNPDNYGNCSQPATSTEPQLGSEVVLNVDRSKVVTVELTKDLVNSIPNNGTPFMDICFDVSGTTTSFTDKFKKPVPRTIVNSDGSTTTITSGLLPDCPTSTDPGPCISNRYKRAANEFIVVNLPQGDPKFTPY